MGESVFGQVDEATLLARLNVVVDEDEDGQSVAAPWPDGPAHPLPPPSASTGPTPNPDDPFAFILTGPPAG